MGGPCGALPSRRPRRIHHQAHPHVMGSTNALAAGATTGSCHSSERRRVPAGENGASGEGLRGSTGWADIDLDQRGPTIRRPSWRVHVWCELTAPRPNIPPPRALGRRPTRGPGGPRVPASGRATESWGALGCVRRVRHERCGLRRSTRSSFQRTGRRAPHRRSDRTIAPRTTAPVPGIPPYSIMRSVLLRRAITASRFYR
jgi:hypothetical protein